jgi:hypothetical protein
MCDSFRTYKIYQIIFQQCKSATPPSPSCGMRLFCLPELLCPPPRGHTLRSEYYSIDAWDPGLQYPPDTRGTKGPSAHQTRGWRRRGISGDQGRGNPAPRRHIFSFSLTISLSMIFARLHPNPSFFPFASPVGSAAGTEELTS